METEKHFFLNMIKSNPKIEMAVPATKLMRAGVLAARSALPFMRTATSGRSVGLGIDFFAGWYTVSCYYNITGDMVAIISDPDGKQSEPVELDKLARKIEEALA